MRRLSNILRRWLPVAIVSVAMSFLTYETVKEALRLSANDPQIQMAQDGAAAIADGETAEIVLPATQVDVRRSLAPFVIVYGDDGRELASSGLLDGRTPALPPGVLDYTRQHGENRVTWQPEGDVRIAAVIVRYEGEQPGFVLAGRSLREIQQRISLTGRITGMVLAVTLAGSLAAIAVMEMVLPQEDGRA